MSTKIYDGFFINETSLPIINSYLKDIRDCLQSSLDNLYLDESCLLGTLIMDYRALGKTDDFIKSEIYLKYNLELEKETSFINLLRELSKKDTNSIYATDTVFDFTIRFLIYSLEDKTLIRIITNKCELVEGIEKKFKFLKEYGYWNNTDKPEKISNKDWELRRIDWDKAIENNISLNFNIKANALFGNNNFSKLELLSEKSYMDRIDFLAKEIVYFNFNLNINKNDEHLLSKVGKALREYKCSEEFKLDLEKEKERIKDIIPSKYTWKEFIRIRI